MARRRRIAHMLSEGEHSRGDRMLQHAADELRLALAANVVYGFIVARDGNLHCVSVSPAEHVRAANLSSPDAPEAIDLLCSGRAGLLTSWNEDELSSAAYFIPWWDEGGPVGAAIAVVDEPLPERVLRLAEAHGSSVGRGIAAAREHEHTQGRLRVLERLNAMLESAFASTSDAVMQIDLDGRVLRWNQAAELLYGWSAEEVIGRPIPSWTTTQRGNVFRELRAIAMSGEPHEYEVSQVTSDGSPLRVRMTAMPMYDEHGNPASVVAVARPQSGDVRHAKAIMSSANLGEVMVRELTSPLTAVIGYAHLLSRPAIIEDPEQRQRVIRGLRGRSEDLAALLEDLLLVARLDAAGLSPERVDMADTLRLLVERLATEDLDSRFDASKIVGAGSALVDRRRTERSIAGLLRCLARNCGHDAVLTFALACDGITTSLKIETREPDEGAARDLAERLQGVGHDELPSDTALGLHVARLVAEAHGGTVSVRRESPFVSSFTLTLPAAVGSPVPEQAPPPTTLM